MCRESVGGESIFNKQSDGSVIPTGGTVVLRYGCTGGLYWWVWWGLVLLYYSVNPVAPGVMGMSFSVFSGLGVGWGLQVDSPRRIPPNPQVILSGHHLNYTLSSNILT